MGSDSNPQTPTSGLSPSGKRSRDPEDDVYVDNLQTHKRYLSEMMASSLNGLTVGDAMPETIMDSPARSENMFYLRDEMSLQYSPMSEDFDDARYCETPMSACSSQSESRPTSPVSPYRYKPMGAFCCSPPSSPLTSNVCNVATGHLSQPRQRGADTEGRFPSSPSDICHSSDLRKAALLRSVQMRAQPSCSSLYDIEYTAAQEPLQTIEGEPRPLDDLQEYHADNCSTLGSSEPGYPVQESLLNTETEKRSCSVMKPSDVEQEYHVEGCSPEPSFGVRKQSTQNIEDGSVENTFIYSKAPEV